MLKKVFQHLPPVWIATNREKGLNGLHSKEKTFYFHSKKDFLIKTVLSSNWHNSIKLFLPFFAAETVFNTLNAPPKRSRAVFTKLNTFANGTVRYLNFLLLYRVTLKRCCNFWCHWNQFTTKTFALMNKNVCYEHCHKV